jgi:hypothetical protein
MKNYWLDKRSDLPGWKDGKIVDMDLWKGKCSKCGEYEWPFNDENIMMQGDPMCACYSGYCNLDIFYPSRFIQNETLDVRSDNGYITTYQVMHTPILPGTMSGYICLEEQCPPLNGWSFTVNSEGKFEVKRYGEWAKNSLSGDDDVLTLQKLAESDEPLISYYDEIHYWETKLNCVTGILELHHHTVGPTPKIVASYEYDKCEV